MRFAVCAVGAVLSSASLAIADTPPSRPDSLDRDDVTAGLAAIRPKLKACDDGSFRGTVHAKVKIAPDGKVASLTVTPRPVFADCLENALQTARFAITRRGGAFNYPLVFSGTQRVSTVTAQAGTCDADALRQQGMDLISQGQASAALVPLQTSFRCRPEGRTANLIFLAACQSKNSSVARQFYPRITNQALVQRCVANATPHQPAAAPQPSSAPGPTSSTPPATSATSATSTGTLEIESDPPGTKVLVDGKPLGTSPLKVRLPAGVHKVTYVVGSDRYTFSARVTAGRTVKLVKDLR